MTITTHTRTATIAATAALLLAGCGGSGTTGATSPVGLVADVAYSQCMRSHGVTAFPDPVGGRIPKDQIPFASPRFATAATACDHVLPPDPVQASTTDTASRLRDRLAFARCLRAHGLPSFPDPTAAGEITHEMVAAAGIDVHQPAVQQAADLCVGVTHGDITRAAVARFIAGQ